MAEMATAETQSALLPRMLYLRRFTALKQESNSWWPAWKDIQKFLVPSRGFFDGTVPNWGAALDHKAILDGHATRQLHTLASGMTSGLTSPSRPWFKLGITDTDLMDFGPTKEWLSTVEERMMAIFSRSNIYGALHSCYAETAAFGTSAMMIVEDYKTVIRARNFTAGEYFLGTGPDGRVNSFARQYKMTSSQMVKEFGIDNVSGMVQNQFQKMSNADSWFDVNLLIEPNDDRIPFRKDFRGKPYRAVYWDPAAPAEQFLRISGYDEFPVLSPRWETTTTFDVYGRGPGWDALGDIKMLQRMQKAKLIGLDRVVDPPVQADSNVSEEINLLPGGVTRSSSMSPNAGLRPAYELKPDIAAIDASIDRTKQGISSFFFADIFMMIASADRPDMTAREIVERHEEKLLQLGPVLERLESELLDPLIERTFNIMLKNNLVPPPPQELQGMELHVEYISMLAQAQKMVGTTAIEQLTRFVGGTIAGDPNVIDNIDLDEAVRQYANMLGTPPKIVRSPDVVAQIRQEKAKQQEEQAQIQKAATMIQGAKVLSDTPVGNNSALDALTGA